MADLPQPAVDYDTSATPGLTRGHAIALLEAADADAGPQAARTDRAGRRYCTPERASPSCSARTSGTWAPRVRRKGGKIQALALPGPAAARVDDLPGRPG